MAANSLWRRILKKLLFPRVNERNYRLIQATVKAWDIRTGSWSEPELQILPFAIRQGDTALDLGANYGLYCYHLSRAVGKTGHVYAFEPVPFTVQTLRGVVQIMRLKNVEIIAKGCSDRAGKVSFILPVQSSGPLSTGQAHMGSRNNQRTGRAQHFPYPKTEEVLCEVVALDDFLPTPHSLSFIKCDIEGAELLAFRGAENLIQKNLPTVLCEINPWFLEGFGIRLEELLDFFFKKGYRLYHYSQNPGGKWVLQEVSLKEVVEDNYLFIHPSREASFASLIRRCVTA